MLNLVWLLPCDVSSFDRKHDTCVRKRKAVALYMYWTAEG